MTAHECITMPDESEITVDRARARAHAHAGGKSNDCSTTKTSSNIRMYVVAVILGSVYSIIATMSASSLIFPPTLVSETNIDIAVSAIKNEESGNNETFNSDPEPAPSARQSKEEPPEIIHHDRDRVVSTLETSNGGIDHGEDRCGIGNYENRTSTSYLGSKLELPLKGSPYYIVQHGFPRSGSTFQNQLLQAIVDLKSAGSKTLPLIWQKNGKDFEKDEEPKIRRHTTRKKKFQRFGCVRVPAKNTQ